ncbi:hypothetical protein M8J77_026097 [Diaphorina citri]|nr:hypothetical protein M8J77_026097 [Diaphorina citri]
MKRMLNALMLCLVFCLVSNGVLVSAFRANANLGISAKTNLQGTPLNMLPNPLEGAAVEGSATVNIPPVLNQDTLTGKGASIANPGHVNIKPWDIYKE